MKDGFAQKQVNQRGIVRLNDEEKDFLSGYGKQSGSDNYAWRICPYLAPDEIGIPGNCRNDSNCNQKADFVEIYAGEERPVEVCQGNGWWDGIFEMPVTVSMFSSSEGFRDLGLHKGILEAHSCTIAGFLQQDTGFNGIIAIITRVNSI